MIDIAPTTLDDPAVVAMFRALDAEIIATSPPGTIHFLTVDATDVEGDGVVLIARIADRPCGCAVLRRIDEGAAEVKRMWVDPDTRGVGVGRALLDELIDRARRLGVGEVRLETDAALGSAVMLYRRFGFTECPPWGPYVDAPDSLCMAVRLD